MGEKLSFVDDVCVENFEGRYFGPDKKEATGDWRKLRKEKLYDLYSAVNIICLMKKKGR